MIVKPLLVLGGNGMLGHRLYQTLLSAHEVFLTFRTEAAEWLNHPALPGLDSHHAFGMVDAMAFDSVRSVVESVRPHVVINCIGIVKQRPEAKDATSSILTNSLFPHQLAELCAPRGIRLIHLSTDCVFSGRRGGYTEHDIPDPTDLYGRSKLLGEPDLTHCMTLRTSMIGWEIAHRAGLLEWFAGQRHGTIEGYRRAVFTGLSTAALAGLIARLIEEWPDLDGLYHVASSEISKYELLFRLKDALGWTDVEIRPNDTFECDRSLDGSRFLAATGWQAPGWDEMIAGLATEWQQYESWRRSN